MDKLLDDYEYNELWKEIRNEWNLDDFLNHRELYNVLENNQIEKYNNELHDKIYNLAGSFYENFWHPHFLDEKTSDFNNEISNAVYLFINKKYDEDIIKNNPELMFKLLE
tara:strand:+ start:252 stop:581 length:330 start_codon:yes stop_codon:yes gene_type:complete